MWCDSFRAPGMVNQNGGYGEPGQASPTVAPNCGLGWPRSNCYRCRTAPDCAVRYERNWCHTDRKCEML